MKGPIAWFARNGIASNLLMLVIIITGLITLPNIKLEVFPDVRINAVGITVPYPGASPAEVEDAICVRVEEQVNGVTGVKEIGCTAVEGRGAVTVELHDWADVDTALDDIKTEIDSIDSFPAEAETPTVKQLTSQNKVISVMVAGDVSERTLRALGEEVRDEIIELPDVSVAELTAVRPFEISIEVSEHDLRRHGLRFDDVVRAVQNSSLDVPAGSIRTRDGEVVLRTSGQAYRGHEFEDIVLLAGLDGSRVRLGDVATVVDGFAETDRSTRFDGLPAVMVRVRRVGTQDALTVAARVREYVETKQVSLPQGVYIHTWDDDSSVLASRIDTMLDNARTGFLLVLCVLALFLRLRLAFWVGIGVPIAMLGAIATLPFLDVSINLLSLTAFIVVLGILVDDAIVVGENVHTHQERGGDPLEAAISGTEEVAVPVNFGVLTTIVAFTPLLFLPGPSGKISRMVPIVVIASLIFSMIESKLILPSHLGHSRARSQKNPDSKSRLWANVQAAVSRGLDRFLERGYAPFLERSLEWRYTAVAVAVAIVFMAGGLMGGGWVRFQYMPSIESDAVIANLTLPEGTPVEATTEAIQRLERAAEEIRAELDSGRPAGAPSVIRHTFSSIGAQPGSGSSSGPSRNAGSNTPNKGQVVIELLPSKQRDQSSLEIGNLWRERTGEIPDTVELTFTSSMFSTGAPIEVELRSNDGDALTATTALLSDELRRFPGVFDITDTLRRGKQELNLVLLPGAEALGLSRADVASQVRQAFYGAEAQRIQRGRDDLRVMVRYPQDDRRSIGDVESMRIRLPDGTAVPLSAIARIESGRGYSTIQRYDRRRTSRVTAEVDANLVTPNEIIAEVRGRILPSILAAYPQVSYRLQGEQREQAEFLSYLGRGFLLALLVIFALLAIPLQSYLQPLIIMSAIPFGMIGGILGHFLLGFTTSMFSVIGLVAVAGVVVNDSLVLVDRINRELASGRSIHEAIRSAGRKRFRPILLTSLTTFAGLTPLMMETSVQAQFLVPMAISLAFGVLFSTSVTLILVPCLFGILADFRSPSAAGRTAVPRQQQEA